MVGFLGMHNWGIGLIVVRCKSRVWERGRDTVPARKTMSSPPTRQARRVPKLRPLGDPGRNTGKEPIGGKQEKWPWIKGCGKCKRPEDRKKE